ncbi:MAG: hypothetical protein AAGJ52_02255 [Pseudomonadota bacterium]
MNKSPDQHERNPFTDGRFEADLAQEQHLLNGDDPGHDLELGADRALKEALGSLEAPALPEELRSAVMTQAHSPSLRSTGWLAMAAAVVLSMVVVLALDPFGEHRPAANISAEDWAQLTLVMATLNQSGEQIAQVTTREVSPHLALPRFDMPSLDIQIEPLPYQNSFRRWFQPSTPRSQ